MRAFVTRAVVWASVPIPDSYSALNSNMSMSVRRNWGTEKVLASMNNEVLRTAVLVLNTCAATLIYVLVLRASSRRTAIARGTSA